MHVVAGAVAPQSADCMACGLQTARGFQIAWNIINGSTVTVSMIGRPRPLQSKHVRSSYRSTTRLRRKLIRSLLRSDRSPPDLRFDCDVGDFKLEIDEASADLSRQTEDSCRDRL